MKTYLLTPAFCKAALLQKCVDWIHKDPLEGVEHVIIDNHYPIDKARNRARIKAIASEYGCTYVDSGKDLGLHHGINNALKVVGFGPEDLIIGCDPDDGPTPGFTKVFREIMSADTSLAVLGATFWVIDMREKEGVFKTFGNPAGHRVMYHPAVEMWTVSAYRGSFIHEIGGFNEPNPYYGGIECFLFAEYSKRGMRLGYTTDVDAEANKTSREDPIYFDPEYRLWKNVAVSGYQGSFEAFLKANHPHRL